MKIEISKANFEDCYHIHEIQIKSFENLLEKYHDYDTNPGAESLEKVSEKFNRLNNTYYKINCDGMCIGAIRVIANDENTKARISPIFILPEYQGFGIAQKSIVLLEYELKNIRTWVLDTIKEEKMLCHLYEKLGYTTTGKEETIKTHMTIKYYEKNIVDNEF